MPLPHLLGATLAPSPTLDLLLQFHDIIITAAAAAASRRRQGRGLVQGRRGRRVSRGYSTVVTIFVTVGAAAQDEAGAVVVTGSAQASPEMENLGVWA